MLSKNLFNLHLFSCLLVWFKGWEELNVGTVPTSKVHNVGTVPKFKMYNIGNVPMFKMQNVGTNVFYDYSLFEYGLYGKSK